MYISLFSSSYSLKSLSMKKYGKACPFLFISQLEKFIRKIFVFFISSVEYSRDLENKKKLSGKYQKTRRSLE